MKKPKKGLKLAPYVACLALCSIGLYELGLIVFFVGIIAIIVSSIKRITTNVNLPVETTVNASTPQDRGVILKCTKCDGEFQINDKFCGKCGAPFSDDNVSVVMDESVNTKIVNPGMFDQMYNLSEEDLLKEFINRELKKVGITNTKNLMPESVIKRKNKLSIIFMVLVFVYMVLIFFHFPLSTYVIGAIVLFIFAKLSSKYDLIKYLSKEIMARPGEKISNIIMSTKSTMMENKNKPLYLAGTLIAVILPLFIFIKPIILYEKVEDGYAVRYYIFGLTNFKTVTIPKEHNGENVVSLRGNTFSNMPFLKEVILPNTITEIRGQAFKNDKKLEKVYLPENLEYLGGGAFYNCRSLKSIKLPETLNYLGGEAFFNAVRLETVNIPSGITEIRGSTFENCVSLKEINIPDAVTRIGGHAFYNNMSLEKVYITEKSMLFEIGSSAFRGCSNLKTITIPNFTFVNERAFKESPTIVYEFKNYIEDKNGESMEYSYTKSELIKLGGSMNVNSFKVSSIVNNADITLEKINRVNNLSEFVLKYKGDDFEEVFTLTYDSRIKVINSNIAVALTREDAFESTSGVYLTTYYN